MRFDTVCVPRKRCANWCHAHTYETFGKAAFFRKFSKPNGCSCVQCPPDCLANFIAFWGGLKRVPPHWICCTRECAVTANRNRCEIIGGNINLGCWHREHTHRGIIVYTYNFQFRVHVDHTHFEPFISCVFPFAYTIRIHAYIIDEHFNALLFNLQGVQEIIVNWQTFMNKHI